MRYSVPQVSSSSYAVKTRSDDNDDNNNEEVKIRVPRSYRKQSGFSAEEGGDGCYYRKQ